VIALGVFADAAWKAWKQTPGGETCKVAYAPVTHPTEPESSSKNDKKKLAEEAKKPLRNWNSGLQILSPAIKNPDVSVALSLMGTLGLPLIVQRFRRLTCPPGCPLGCTSRMAGRNVLERMRKLSAEISPSMFRSGCRITLSPGG